MKRTFHRALAPALALLLGVLVAGCGEGDGSMQGNTQTPDNPGKSRPKVSFEGGGFDAPFERIRIEAEDGKIVQEEKLFRPVDDPEASGGKCLTLPDKCGKPEEGKIARVVYEFEVKKAGHYTFWCRRKWLDGCGDTLAVRIDKTNQPHKVADLFGSDDSSKPPRWGWSHVRLPGENKARQQYYLTEGKHTLEILNREDGPRYDVLLLTEDPDYVPMGLDE